MTLTLTRIEHNNIPVTLDSGSSVRRVASIFVEATSTSVVDTLNLATYVQGLQGIMGFRMVTLDSAAADKNATQNSWSGTTITFAGHSGSGGWKIEVLGNF